MSRSIEIAKLRLDGGTQPRAELNRETVDEYADAMKAGQEFPAVVVFHDGSAYWLADGFHRVNAGKLAGRAMIDADVRQGTRRDAVLFACGANHGHGLRRTNADKRRAVETLLRDDEWAKWSDREIARRCAVNDKTVSAARAELSAELPQMQPLPGRLVQRNGTTYTQNTANIGRRPEARTETLEPVPAPPRTSTGDVVRMLRGDPLPVIPAEEIRASQEKAAEDSETKFNRTNDNVEWALWTWNPITGCLHDCAYCYARDIAERFYPQKFVPTIHPARFGASTRTPFPSPERVAAPFDQASVRGGIGEKNVFTCSMADLFGKWVPTEWIEKVLDEIRSNPNWNYLLLTKFPQRLADFEFPGNAWVGTTVDTQARVAAAEKAFEKFDAPVKWLSCEPMMERLTFKRLDLFDWVVIGGASRSTQTAEFKPPFEWACHLYTQAKAAGCSVYMKTNLLDRVREYPK